MRIKTFFIALFVLALAQIASAETYTIDGAHSTIGFVVKHLGINEVHGRFTKAEGTIEFDAAKPEATKAQVTIDAKSVNTDNEGRDGHLRKPEFFDTDKFPTITFKTTSVTADGKGYVLNGDLTIKETTKTVSIPVVVNGPVKHPMNGSEVIGLNGQTKINRQDFGVSWNKAMDQGGFLVGDEVTININVEAAKK